MFHVMDYVAQVIFKSLDVVSDAVHGNNWFLLKGGEHEQNMSGYEHFTY